MEQKTLEQVEKEYIKELVAKVKGDINKAAKLSGIARATIYRKLRIYDIQYKCFR